MLFFRSEDEVNEWCRDRKLPVRPILSLATQWQLALVWYADRLSPSAKRPGPAEMRSIFENLGLRGAFWDPESDHF